MYKNKLMKIAQRTVNVRLLIGFIYCEPSQKYDRYISVVKYYHNLC